MSAFSKSYEYLRAGIDVVRSGGPAGIKLRNFGEPRGWLIPSWQLDLEIKGRDGRRTRLQPQLPVPAPWAWSYRVARAVARLGLRRRS